MQIIYNQYIGDYVHNCDSGIAALDNDDILNFHTSFTEDGTTTQQQAGMALQKGLMNTNLTVEQGAKKVDVESLTERGNRISLFRQRKHREYIEIKNKQTRC